MAVVVLDVVFSLTPGEVIPGQLRTEKNLKPKNAAISTGRTRYEQMFVFLYVR